MPTLKEFATYLHKRTCTYNHTDYCGWYYEECYVDCWSNYAHNRYLKEAKDMCKFLGITLKEE